MENQVVTSADQEQLALALEEAAERVRQAIPAGYEVEVRDDVGSIPVDHRGGSIPGPRSPLVRSFRVEW